MTAMSRHRRHRLRPLDVHPKECRKVRVREADAHPTPFPEIVAACRRSRRPSWVARYRRTCYRDATGRVFGAEMAPDGPRGNSCRVRATPTTRDYSHSPSSKSLRVAGVSHQLRWPLRRLRARDRPGTDPASVRHRDDAPRGPQGSRRFARVRDAPRYLRVGELCRVGQRERRQPSSGIPGCLGNRRRVRRAADGHSRQTRC